MKNIGILVASVQKNMELALKIQELTTELEASGEIINLVALDLPMYTSILEDEKGIPNEVTMQYALCSLTLGPMYCHGRSLITMLRSTRKRLLLVSLKN